MESLIKRAAKDLAESKYAIALTGAGMSTESDIPDFRGPKASGPRIRRQRLGLIKDTSFS